MKEQHTVAIVGAGNIADTHALILQHLPMTTVTAVFDVRREKAKDVVEEFFMDGGRYLKRIRGMEKLWPHHKE